MMLRKKELSALPELIGGAEDGISAVAEIVEIGGAEILHIDVSEFGKMLVRYFADKKAGRWICFGKNSGWNQMGLYSAIDFELSRGDYEYYGGGGYRYYRVQAKPNFDALSSELVDRYFDGSKYWCTGTEWLITEWEQEIRGDKRERQMSNKMYRIKQIMDRVPALPDDFEDWLKQEIFPDEFLYIKRQGKKTEYTCTACGKTGARRIKARVGEETACPRCGKTVQVRSMNRKYRPQVAPIVLMQKMTLPRKKKDLLDEFLPDREMYVERQMTVECRAYKGEKELRIYEGIRAIVPKKEHWGDVYYGEYTDGTPWDQSFWTSNPKNWRWKNSYLYPNNLGDVLQTAGMEHSGIDILARKKIPVNVDFFVVKYPNMRWIEYLIKAGLYRLVQDIVNNGIYFSRDRIIREKGRTLQECLMLDAAGVSRMKQLNGGCETLEWLRVENRMKMKVSQESLKFLTDNRISPWDDVVAKMLRYMKSPNRLANYIKKQMDKTGYAASTILSTWNDYMDMCGRLKRQTDIEMIYKPKDVTLAHDECLALLKREDAGRRAEEVRKKFPEAELNMRMMTEKYEFSDETYKIVVPQCIEDIIVEGGTLGHCIDRTDVYFDRIQSRTSFLVFLRKTERPDAPWYTLEIEPGGTVRQKRTVGNTQRDEDVKAFTPFLREWQKHVLRKMNEADKELAKASREARLTEYADLRARKEPIRNGILRGQLLADVLEADLMEVI